MKSRTLFISSGIVVLLCMGIYRFYSFPSLAIAEQSFSYVIYPFLRIQNMFVQPCKNFFYRIKKMQELEESLEKVSTEREQLLAKVVSLQASMRFVDETAELIAFKKNYQEKPQNLAHVILKNFSDKGHFFLIDAGSSSGVSPDMIAIYKNCLIGRVTEVYPYYSKVVLITDRNCKVAAYCPTTQACGIHEGINDDTISTLQYVNHLQQIHKNDLILSSGEGLVFPRGFGLGTVQFAQVEGVHYTIRIAPLLDLHNISYCYLLQKGAKTIA